MGFRVARLFISLGSPFGMIAEATFGLGWSIHPQGNLICTDITRDWAGNFRDGLQKA
jgi:hypothetical protein